MNRRAAPNDQVESELAEEFHRQDAKITGEEEERVRIEPGREWDELAHRVIGAAIEVHRHLGPSFLEAVDRGALVVELRPRGVAYEQEMSITVGYQEVAVGEAELDFPLGRGPIVEPQAVEALGPIRKPQVISYPRATKLRLGLLIDFNVPILKNVLRRVLLSWTLRPR